MFQSSPGAKTGCNATTESLNILVLSFNPHPVQRPGATIKRITTTQIIGCFNPHPVQRPGATPITHTYTVNNTRFQSSPGAKTGCNASLYEVRMDFRLVSILTRCKDRVQPAGALRRRRVEKVSILTRCKDRVQRLRSRFTTPPDECFNPHPVQRPGATVTSFPDDTPEKFQSSPGAKTGCNSTIISFGYALHGFNPHPVQRPGATSLR